LTPSQVIIKLVDDRDFIKRSQLIDVGLRQISSIMNTGIVSTEHEGEFSSDICVQHFCNKFFSYFRGLGAVITA
jgi:hypothetical protein